MSNARAISFRADLFRSHCPHPGCAARISEINPANGGAPVAVHCLDGHESYPVAGMSEIGTIDGVLLIPAPVEQDRSFTGVAIACAVVAILILAYYLGAPV